jgi:hypothetical protein
MAFAREKLPPGFASTNEFALAVDSLTNWSTVICHPHQPERVYYGLYGGALQAEYDVTGTVSMFCLLRLCFGGSLLACAQIMVSLFPDENCDTDGLEGYKLSSAETGDGHRRLSLQQSGWRGAWGDWLPW